MRLIPNWDVPLAEQRENRKSSRMKLLNQGNPDQERWKCEADGPLSCRWVILISVGPAGLAGNFFWKSVHEPTSFLVKKTNAAD